MGKPTLHIEVSDSSFSIIDGTHKVTIYKVNGDFTISLATDHEVVMRTHQVHVLSDWLKGKVEGSNFT